MIREFEQKDTDQIMAIWLNSNLLAHHFINQKYWYSHYDIVRDQYLPEAKTYVYEAQDGSIHGFISVQEQNGHVAGLFVDPDSQGRGIGGELINYIQHLYSILSLKVYVKNPRAIKFYRDHGFKLISKGVDKNTNQDELLMYWSLGYITISEPESHSSM